MENEELDERQMVYRGAVRLICSITFSVLSFVPHRSMLIATIKILSYPTIYIFHCNFSQACLWMVGCWIQSMAASHFGRRAYTVHSAFETGTEWNTMYHRCLLHFCFVGFLLSASYAVWQTMPKQSSSHRCHSFFSTPTIFFFFHYYLTPSS